MQTHILEYLEHTVTRVPDKWAYVDDEAVLTFREVYNQARSVGSFLCGRSAGREPVAVFMERHPAMIAAFWGVLYGGCFYVPMDNEIPPYRIDLILETLNPRIILCDEKTKPLLQNRHYAGELYVYQEICHTPEDTQALERVRARAVDVDPAYIVFTSGSTGVPKGVVASHRSVIDYIENLSQVLGLGADTIFGNQTPLYVDACLKEIVPTLKFGATTYLIPKSLFMFPVRLIEYLNEKQINTICWVVSALTLVSGFGALDKTKPETLRIIAFGSEVFPVKQFNRWRQALPDTRFIHLYGPTEATGMSAYYEVDRMFDGEESIPIGQAFRNTEILLLTDEGREALEGEVGEICIRGAGLALGYYNDPEKTAASFVQNPLNPAFKDLIYKTGDLGKRNAQGELVFLSRRDHQIKHMGHRIELAEIEMAASRQEDVQMVCCVFEEAASKIVLYYTGEAEMSSVTAYCKQTLPRYMWPSRYIRMDILPLTPNGKIDRVKLLNEYKKKI